MLNNYQINNSKIVYAIGSNYQNESLEEQIEASTLLDRISIVAKLAYTQFTYSDFEYEKDGEEATMEEVNAYRDAKRRAGKLYHKVKNTQIASTLNIKDYESSYVCSLLPYIEYTFEQDEYSENKDKVLAKITSHREVEEVVIQECKSKRKDSFNLALGEAWAGDIYDDGTYTGDGVTVGILETGLVNTSHENMSDHTILTYSQSGHSGSVTDHATIVASLIGGNTGMAPDATLLSASLYGNIYEEVEWLVDNGADIINMSFGETDPDGVYDDNSGFMDNIVKTYDVVAVAAVGNGGNDVGKVCNPALGYNVIGVGSADMNGNVSSFTSNVVTFGPDKPTIVTSGRSLTIEGFGMGNSGTSYSCAFTSGMIATLLEAHPSLKTRAEMVIAMVCANAYYQSGYDKTEASGFNRYNGAGRFNLEETIQNYNRILTFNNSVHTENSLVYQFSAYIREGRILQASFAWLVSVRSDSMLAYYNRYYAEIVNSSGEIVATANSMYCNVLFMRYPVTTSGHYVMKIYAGSVYEQEVDRMAFAYRFE